MEETNIWKEKLGKAIEEAEKFFTQYILSEEIDKIDITYMRDKYKVTGTFIDLDENDMKIYINRPLKNYYDIPSGIYITTSYYSTMSNEKLTISETLRSIGISDFVSLFNDIDPSNPIYKEIHSIFDEFLNNLGNVELLNLTETIPPLNISSPLNTIENMISEFKLF